MSADYSFDSTFVTLHDSSQTNSLHFQAPSFCVLHRSEALLESPQFAKLFHSFFSSEELAGYRSRLDLLFCKIYPEWAHPCQNYYTGRGGRLFSYAQVSPKVLLDWDGHLADVILPRMKNLYLKGRRRWQAVERDLRVPAPPKAPRLLPTQNLPLSLKMNHHCSTALELARLRGVLCRDIHALVESARWEDEEWFRRSMNSIKSFVAAVPKQMFGVELASQILAERLAYVQTLPQYGSSLRARFSSMMEHYRRLKNSPQSS